MISSVEAAVTTLCEGIPLALLQKYFRIYSEGYREQKTSKQSIPGKIEKICYMATRFPATFAASCFVFKELKRRLGNFHSLLDFGAGPGTALLAALHEEIPVEKAVLIEAERDFIALSKEFLPFFVEWEALDFLKCQHFPLSEVTIFCYSLGEIQNNEKKKLLQKAWEASTKALVIIEPGTPFAFKNLLESRQTLIDLGGHIVAPCPHSQLCPLVAKKDWCHFSVRLRRTSLHRKIKGAELGFEDEKFCYMVVAKEPVLSSFSRVIKSPKKQSGFIDIELCTQRDGLC